MTLLVDVTESGVGRERDTRALLDWILAYQRRRGWNRSEFADAAGVDSSIVSRWFQGRQPRPASLARMAESLGADYGTLLRLAGYGGDDDALDTEHAELIAKLRQVRLSPDRFHILDVLLEDLRRREP